MNKIPEDSENQHPRSDDTQRPQQPAPGDSRAIPYPGSGEPTQAPSAGTQRASWLRLPAELRERRQWALAGPDKRPLTADGRAASPTDPSTWISFDEACNSAESKGLHIGYVLDPSDPFTCIDLDVNDVTPQEHIDRHRKIMTTLDSYTEHSLSGRGFHIWVKGKIGKGRRRDDVEVYSQGRFIVCTGNVYIDKPIEKRQAELDMLIDEMPSSTVIDISLTGNGKPNMALAARAAEDQGELGRLFRGDWQGRYPSPSEADFGLLCLLLPECDSIEDVWPTFLLSKLGERVKAKRLDYAKYTLAAALQRLDEGREQIRHGKQMAQEILQAHAAKPPTPPRSLVELLSANELNPQPIRWLWPGWLARGKLHVLAGAPGTGKTTLLMSLAATVSVGGELPDGVTAERGRVIIWSGEDDPTDTLLPRLMAADADLSYVQFVGNVTDKLGNRSFNPATDMPKLEAAAPSDVALIIIDPIVSAVSGDSHKNAEVRRSLTSLVELAMKLDAPVIGITHYSKGTQGRDPLERVSGSLAFGALARVVLGTAQQQQDDDDDDTPRRMVVARAKSNIGPDGGGFLYGFEQVDMGNGISASRIIWERQLYGTARDLLDEPEADDNGNGPQSAIEFLRELLAGGHMAPKEVERHGKAAGFSFRSLQRARKRAGFKSKKLGFGTSSVWSLE